MNDLTLPSTVLRRNKLDISLGYCGDIYPPRLLSLGPAVEIRVGSAPELIDFVEYDADDDRVYFVNHFVNEAEIERDRREWEYVCFARCGEWVIFCSIFSTVLAFNPLFGDSQRRRLCSGGTRIIDKLDLEHACHRELPDRMSQVVAALTMDLDLSQAMTEKNLSNGFNVGGSKTLVYVGDRAADVPEIAPEEVRKFARFMGAFHNSLLQTLPIFVGTGSDLNFKAYGDDYYDFCSRISPCYVGNPVAARRWRREAAEDTTGPTAHGVIACIDAVSTRLNIIGDERAILVKGIGGIGSRIAAYYAERDWRVFVTDTDIVKVDGIRATHSSVTPVAEEEWGAIGCIAIFSPNASSGSLTEENLPLLKTLGTKAVVGGENNIRARGVDAESVYRITGILTFPDFLLNGGGAWIVDAEMVERPAADVVEWIETYQVPTLLKTIDIAERTKRSPESIFSEFIRRKVRELIA